MRVNTHTSPASALQAVASQTPDLPDPGRLRLVRAAYQLLLRLERNHRSSMSNVKLAVYLAFSNRLIKRMSAQKGYHFGHLLPDLKPYRLALVLELERRQHFS